MISEHQAVMMIETELPAVERNRIQKKYLYEFVQSYASRMCELGTIGDKQNFETQLMVANRLYSEGCEEVKEVMEKVFMSSLSHMLELNKELLVLAKKNLHGNLMNVMHHYHLAGNP